MKGATLTRAHFIALADAIADMDLGKDSREEVIKHIRKVCWDYNADFDSSRFEDYINKKLVEKHFSLREVDRTPLNKIVL